MSSTVTIRQSRGVGVVGLISIIAGVLMILAGGATWWAVADKLSQEGIVVSEDASFLAGKKVNDPFSAFAQAEVINKHALEMSDGQTYAQLEQDDPRRETVMNASFLRASLFTSVVSFGIAALVAGLGVLFILVGWALRRVAGGPPVVVETSSGSRTAGSHQASADEVQTRRSTRDKSDRIDKAEKDGATTVVPGATTTGAEVSTPAAAPTASQDPVRLSRSDRAATPSPAPAGERPTTGTTPVVTSGGTDTGAADTTSGTTPAKDDRLGGWASPADRVTPPSDRTAPGEPTGGSDDKA